MSDVKVPTAAEALELARAIVADHDDPIRGPCYVDDSDREIRLARFVEAVLAPIDLFIPLVMDHLRLVREDGVSPDGMRAIASALLRAADAAERGKEGR